MSVVVAAFTEDRWPLLERCMDSIRRQTVPVTEVVLCIDNNEALYERAHAQWHAPPATVVIRNPDDAPTARTSAHERAHGVRRRFGAGSARDAAIAETSGEIVATIDDDAHAPQDWLERLITPFVDEDVVAVGGPPVAEFEVGRPGWLPRAFDWTFGCAYEGLPRRLAPARRLIGANLAVRRTAYDKVGGFRSIDFEDLDICMRFAHEFGRRAIVWNPSASVRHYVPAERTTWRYFWRRCLYVNVVKVETFAALADAANLRAEVGFAVRTATVGVARELRSAVTGDLDGARRAAVILCGLALAAAGNGYGRWRVWRDGR